MAEEEEAAEEKVFAADGAWHRLDDNFVPAERMAGLITLLVFAAVFVVGIIILWIPLALPWWIVSLAAAGSLLVLGVLAFFGLYWPRLAYRYTSYSMDPAGIEIRRGVVWRKVISVPRSRIQHMDLSQGPIERKYDLSTIMIHTAGTLYSKVDLSGLHHETARGIRDFLIAEHRDDAV